MTVSTRLHLYENDFDYAQVRLMVGMAPVAAVPHMYSPIRFLTPVATEVNFSNNNGNITTIAIFVSWREFSPWLANTSSRLEIVSSQIFRKHFVTR